MNFFEWRKKIKESTFWYKTLMSKNQNGRSMVEVLGVLAMMMFKPLLMPTMLKIL